MGRVIGLLTVALSVLATIYVYNKFSGSNVGLLGAGSAAK